MVVLEDSRTFFWDLPDQAELDPPSWVKCRWCFSELMGAAGPVYVLGGCRLHSIPSSSSPGSTPPLGSCCVVLIRALLFRFPTAILDSGGGRGRQFLILASLRSTTGRLSRQFSSCHDLKVAFNSRKAQKWQKAPAARGSPWGATTGRRE